MNLENTAGAREAALIVESYRRGQADAFKLALTRLSALNGGALPRGGKAFRLELDKIVQWLYRSEDAHRAAADEARSRVVTPLAATQMSRLPVRTVCDPQEHATEAEYRACPVCNPPFPSGQVATDA